MTTLDAQLIREALGPRAAACLERFEAFAEIDSTNTFLKNEAPPERGNIHVAVADHQTAGRGRRERAWVSAPGDSVCLSMSYAFRRPPKNLPAVTLAIGVGVAQALKALGVDAIGLKWPNDLMVGDRKLGGILTETQFRGPEDVSVVTGIGLNVSPAEKIAAGSRSGDKAAKKTDDMPGDADWAPAAIGLASVLPEVPPREALAGALISAMFDAFVAFDFEGIERFAEDFSRFDWLAGRQVEVDTPSGALSGIAKGIDETGALLVEREGDVEKIVSGTVLSVGPA